jgi:hypothetical protein
MSERRRFTLFVLVAGVIAFLAWWRPGFDAARTTVSRDASPAPNAFVQVDRAPSVAPPTPRAAVASQPEPPPLPFTFMGMVSEQGQAKIVLRRGGRVYKVTGPGPLDEQYSVEAIQEGLMLIRYLPMGVQQVLELSARQEAPPAAPAAETEQD